jgi:hypothetical protein
MLGRSRTAVRFQLDKLIEDGIITHTPGKIRTIRVVEEIRGRLPPYFVKPLHLLEADRIPPRPSMPIKTVSRLDISN